MGADAGGIDVTLITDSMAAHTMKEKQISAVIVGADRIAKNGDTANKIGTYGLAILANAFDIPFFVAAPLSTFDTKVKCGADIPIEERDPEEVRQIPGVRPLHPMCLSLIPLSTLHLMISFQESSQKKGL